MNLYALVRKTYFFESSLLRRGDYDGPEIVEEVKVAVGGDNSYSGRGVHLPQQLQHAHVDADELREVVQQYLRGHNTLD